MFSRAKTQRVCVCVCERARVHACVCARACVYECVFACLCVRVRGVRGTCVCLVVANKKVPARVLGEFQRRPRRSQDEEARDDSRVLAGPLQPSAPRYNALQRGVSVGRQSGAAQGAEQVGLSLALLWRDRRRRRGGALSSESAASAKLSGQACCCAHCSAISLSEL